jgi:hypothetical protein
LQLFHRRVADFTDSCGVGCSFGRLDFGGEFLHHSKVNQHRQLVVFAPNYIFRGDVAVDDAAGVDVSQYRQHLPDKYQDFGFGEGATLGSSIEQQFAVSHPFHVILH